MKCYKDGNQTKFGNTKERKTFYGLYGKNK